MWHLVSQFWLLLYLGNSKLHCSWLDSNLPRVTCILFVLNVSKTLLTVGLHAVAKLVSIYSAQTPPEANHGRNYQQANKIEKHKQRNIEILPEIVFSGCCIRIRRKPRSVETVSELLYHCTTFLHVYCVFFVKIIYISLYSVWARMNKLF